MKDLCGFCHQVTEPYLVSQSGKAMLCESCTGEVQRRAPAINRAKLLPHIDNERRSRPMPNPFEKPKMEEFKHGLPND